MRCPTSPGRSCHADPVTSPPPLGRARSAGLVLLGGTAGSLARYLLVLATPAPAGLQVLTIGAVNLVGSLLLGLLIGTTSRTAEPTRTRHRLLLGTGALGGFTTYSTFALQVVEIAHDGAWFLAAFYPAVSVVVGVGAAALGLRLGRRRAARAAGGHG